MSLPDPIVLLDARARYVHPAFTLERASPKWLFGPDGRRHRVPENAMPWEYDPLTGASRGLLIEASRTNLVTHSGDLTQWNDVGPVAVSDSGIASTVRGKNWFRLESTGTGEQQRVLRSDVFSVTEGEYYTHSIDVMPGEVRFLMLFLDGAFRDDLDSAGVRVTFDLEDGEANVHHPEYLIGARATQLRNGAWRLEAAAQAYETSSTPMFRVLLKNGMGYDVSSQINIGDGLYLCAPQVEPNQYGPAAISYIETEGASAQRSADTLSLQNIIDWPWFGGLSGTFVIEHSGDSYNAEQPLLKLGQSTASFDGLLLRRHGSGNMGVRARLGSDFYGSGSQAPLDGLNRSAVSFDFAEEDMAHVMNGSVVDVSTAPALSLNDIASLYIGTGAISGGTERYERRFEGWIRRVVYYPQRLSNADLQSLTAMQE